MRIAVCRPGELGRAEVDAWHRFQRAHGLTNPFLSPEFARAADSVYPNARVAVAYDGPELVGFLPYMARSLRTATPIGDDMSNVQAFIHGDGDWPIEEVVRGARLDLIEFHALVAAQAGAARAVRPTPSFLIDLSAGYEAYVAEARRSGRSYFKEVLRKRRRLEREDPTVRFEMHVRDREAIDALCAWKSRQYRRTGQRDRLARSGVRELVERVVYSDDEAMRGCLSMLRSENRIVAVGLGLRSGDTLAVWISTYDVTAAPLSPGAVWWLCVAEEAAADGVRRVDLSTGEMEYKRRMSNATTDLTSCWIGRLSRGALVKRGAHVPIERARRFVDAHPRVGGVVKRARGRTGALRGRGPVVPVAPPVARAAEIGDRSRRAA